MDLFADRALVPYIVILALIADISVFIKLNVRHSFAFCQKLSFVVSLDGRDFRQGM